MAKAEAGKKGSAGRAWGLSRPAWVFIAVFFSALAIVAYVEHVNITRERDRIAHLSRTVTSDIYETILSEMGKTRVMEAYLIQSGGEYRGFDRISHILLQEDFVRNVLFAPKGVVSAVYPLEGNESVVGLNMYDEGAGNKEAQAAIEKGELYVAGPFELIQGGMGIAGRLPVYLEGEGGGREFWGIVSVTLDFPEVLPSSSLSWVEEQGFACEVWRINPDTNSRQVIMSTGAPLRGKQALDYSHTMFNSTWIVSMASIIPWYGKAGLWLGILISLLLGLLAAMGFRNQERLRELRAEEAKREIVRLKEQLEYEQGNMLISQIRSHFFYHTLNALQALIVLQPEAAYKMAGDFSRYLRFSLDASASEGGMVSFKEEMRAVRAYVDINQAQLGDRLKTIYRIPDADFIMPALTIQPIVENAILHGIKPKLGGGTVTVELMEGEDCWQVTVEDDGVGFSPEELPRGERSPSIGLANVKERLARSPGCGIEIRSVPGSGTRITVTYGK